MQKKLEKQKVKEEVNTVRFEGGKFCLDIAKLVIAGVILTGMMKENPVSWVIYLFGGFVTILFIVMGLSLIKFSKQRR